jgi:hypothetical protein
VGDRDGGEEKGMLITENYKNVHNGHDHGVLWEKPHELNPKIKTHLPISTATQERQPSNTFHPATVEQHHLRHVYIG